MKIFVKKIISYLIPKELYSSLDGGLSILKSATYKSDGIATIHNSDFLKENKFKDSFLKGLEGVPAEYRSLFDTIRWRAHICCWAANQAKNLDGDFVECGVWYGVLSRTIVEYIEFDKIDKNFYLLDAFGNLGRADYKEYEPDIFEVVKSRFSKFKNVHLIQGIVPATLNQVPSKKIAYLSIDMNGIEPEREALTYFYQKMVPGGIIYFDDYGWAGHGELKKMIDNFFQDKPENILYMPTGQGIVVKI